MHRLFAKKTEDMNEDNNIVITGHLHLMCDGLPVGEDIAEVAGPQHVPQRGGSQQPGRAAVVVHVGHGADRVLEHQIFLKAIIEYIFSNVVDIFYYSTIPPYLPVLVVKSFRGRQMDVTINESDKTDIDPAF